MTALLNWRLWAAAGVAVLLAWTHFFVYRTGKAVVRNDFDAYKLAQSEARILADRAREQRNAARQAAIDKEAQDGQARIAAIEAERDAARADGERLRSDYARAASRARAVACTPSPGQGEPRADAIGVFAELLERADRRAEAVAGYADRLRAAGLVCERGWDAVRGVGRE